MPNPIQKQTLSNSYTDAATIQDVWPANGGWFTFGPEADAFFQVQYASDPRAGGQGLSSWTPEQHAYANSSWTLPAGASGIRARNYTAGSNGTLSGYIAARIVPGASPVAFGTSTVGSMTLLGRYTPSQWPPANPGDSNVAVLYDDGSVSGLVFAWPLQYASAANNWTPYAGIALSPAELGFGLALTVNGHTNQNAGTFKFPVGGTYSVRVKGGGGSGTTGTVTGSLSVGTVSGTGTDIATISGAVGDASALGWNLDSGVKSYAATRLLAAYVNYSLATGLSMGWEEVTVVPTTIDNA